MKPKCPNCGKEMHRIGKVIYNDSLGNHDVQRCYQCEHCYSTLLESEEEAAIDLIERVSGELIFDDIHNPARKG